MRTIDTASCGIHKKIPFSTPCMPSLIRDFFSKCTDFYAKECKLYNKLLNKTSVGTKSLVSNSSEKDESALVLIPHTYISPIQNNFPTHSLSSSLSYKFISLPPTPGPKKSTVKIKKTNNVNSDVEMQLPSPQ